MGITGLEDFIADSEEKESDDDSLAIVGVPSDTRFCACGCGTILPPTYKWSYKRGHKLASMGGTVPLDPDRPDSGEVSSASFSGVRITKKMKDDIEGQLALLFGVVTMGWGMRDPLCASAFVDNMDEICAKTVPIICKSPTVVQWMLKNGGLLDWIGLALAMKPVIQTIAAHHIFHTIGDDKQMQSVEEQNFAYPVG